MINAAAAITTSITLSTTVSVLSTDDPIRLYQQMAPARRRRPSYSPGGMVFAGDPEEIAGRIIDLHHHLGHMRHTSSRWTSVAYPTPRYSSPSSSSEPKSHPESAPT